MSQMEIAAANDSLSSSGTKIYFPGSSSNRKLSMFNQGQRVSLTLFSMVLFNFLALEVALFKAKPAYMLCTSNNEFSQMFSV